MIYKKLKNPRIKLSVKARTYEAWYPLRGYENYAISTHGKIRSLDHFTLMQMGTSKEKRLKFFRGKLLKFRLNKDGYCSISLNKNQKRTRPLLVHTLVFETFIGDRIKGMVINHLDFDRTNNRVINLEQVTIQQNDQHSTLAGRKGSISVSDIKIIRKEKSYKRLSKMFPKLDTPTLWRIKTGQLYRWAPGKINKYVWSKLKEI